jgi:hypothetical protein
MPKAVNGDGLPSVSFHCALVVSTETFIPYTHISQIKKHQPTKHFTVQGPS